MHLSNPTMAWYQFEGRFMFSKSCLIQQHGKVCLSSTIPKSDRGAWSLLLRSWYYYDSTCQPVREDTFWGYLSGLTEDHRRIQENIFGHQSLPSSGCMLTCKPEAYSSLLVSAMIVCCKNAHMKVVLHDNVKRYVYHVKITSGHFCNWKCMHIW
jgi:hypothetical protein